MTVAQVGTGDNWEVPRRRRGDTTGGEGGIEVEDSDGAPRRAVGAAGQWHGLTRLLRDKKRRDLEQVAAVRDLSARTSTRRR